MHSKLAWFERDQPLVGQFRTGVSIHSHTSRSKESLEFVERILYSHPLLKEFMRAQENNAGSRGISLNLRQGYWTPPLCPRSAYELEKRQIEEHLGLGALVSLSDHDCIEAPMLLAVVPALRDTPVSVEWTVPFQSSKFHLGVHNLPQSHAQEWMNELRSCTADPSTDRVCDVLRSLHSVPEVMVVFNHPLWNLYGNPPAQFDQNVEDFLALNNACIHAFELNGLRRWEENQRVIALAARWQQLLISGGDRHGCEPNANLNLTNAASFSEWVHEIRVERRSQLLFMPQYNYSLVARCYQTFLDAIREYPAHSDGAFRWDQRTCHPGRDGSVQPLSRLWAKPPAFLQAILGFARLAESTHLLDAVRVPFGRSVAMMTGATAKDESTLSGIAGQEEATNP